MNVADLELCEELYELSGWDSEFLGWHSPNPTKPKRKDGVVAYDLGFLLGKLPAAIEIVKEQPHSYTASTIAPTEHLQRSDTPENAACKLAIELFKAGVLQKEEL